MGRVVVIGSINADVIASVPALPAPESTILGTSVQTQPGGKGLNQAVAAARAGADVVFAGCVGSDPWADALLEFVRTTSIDHSFVRRADASTGVAIVMVASDGTNHIVVIPGANRARGIAEATSAAVASVGPGDVVLAQLELPPAVVGEALAAARARGAKTVLNPSPIDDVAADQLRDILAAATVVVVNEREAAALDLPRTRRPGQLAIVTRGADDVSCTDDDGTFSVPARPTVALDTTGAGDCFTGVLAAGLASGHPLRPTIERAIVAASLQVGRVGAAPAMPTAAEIDAALD